MSFSCNQKLHYVYLRIIKTGILHWPPKIDFLKNVVVHSLVITQSMNAALEKSVTNWCQK